MTPGHRGFLALTIAGALALGLSPSAAAHTPHKTGTPVAGAKIDAGEVAALGIEHAREHARTRAVQRAARQRWQRLTPRQRRQRIARARRESAALRLRLAALPRDDIGSWDTSVIALPDYAIHATMMPTGKVLIFGREPLIGGGPRSNRGSARIFDPATGVSTYVPPPPIPENAGMEAPLFCAAQALLSDGRVLVVGGNLHEPEPPGNAFAGLNYTFIFDPFTESWQTGPKMQHGRWYPTVTKLASGDVIIASGLDEDGFGNINPEMDIYRPGAANPSPLVPLPAGERGTAVNLGHRYSLYPGMFLLPDGDVALAGPDRERDSAILDTPTLLNPGAAPGAAWQQIPSTLASVSHFGGSPVIEPDLGAFAGSWNLLVTGGAGFPGLSSDLLPARATVDRLTAGPGTPVWSHSPQDDMQQERFYLQNVLLPDGGIVAVGGGLGNQQAGPDFQYYVGPSPPPALRQVELRRPGERTWRLGAAQQEYRTYHSTAWLLPDGRVVSAGDDGHEGDNPANPLPDSTRRDSAEIYSPPYLFDGDELAPRPLIAGVGARSLPAAPAPAAVLTYGEQFGIFSQHAGAGMKAVLVAPAAVTHGVDMNQRLVPLQIASTIGARGLNAVMAPNANVAPPGWYMLFVIDAAGTPSVARWVRVLAPADAAAARGGVTPLLVAADEGTPLPAPPPPPPPGPKAKRSSKLALSRATIERARRQLDVVAQISALATGRVRLELFAAGKRTRFSAPIDRKRRRVALRRTIPAAQAKLGTGILTMTYGGDAGTRPLSVRLRAARRSAGLRAVRPSYRAGVLRASGRISDRARGVVRVQLEFEKAGRTEMVQRTARIEDGRWTLTARLPPAVRARIAARGGTLDAYVMFTGDQGRRMRGEMRSYEVLRAP